MNSKSILKYIVLLMGSFAPFLIIYKVAGVEAEAFSFKWWMILLAVLVGTVFSSIYRGMHDK